MKVLIAGLGSIGQRHVRNIRRIFGDSIEIIAYRARGLSIQINDNMTAEHNVNLAKKYNLRVYSDYGAALKEKPDIVFITNPTALHIPTAIEAAYSGCHLFIEKPLSHNLDGIKELENIVKKKNLSVLVGFQLRFNPCLKLIDKLLIQRRIGNIITAKIEFGEFLPQAHPYEDYRKAYTAKKDLGGGVVLAFSHEIDYAYWLFGMPKRVFTLGGKISNLDIEAEDTASILMEYRIGGRTVPVHLHLDFIQSPPKRSCEIIGDKGKIFWDYYDNKVLLYPGGRHSGKVFDFGKLRRNDMFIEEIRHFFRAIKGKEEPLVSLNDGINSLKIVMAIKKSINNGKIVAIDS